MEFICNTWDDNFKLNDFLFFLAIRSIGCCVNCFQIIIGFRFDFFFAECFDWKIRWLDRFVWWKHIKLYITVIWFWLSCYSWSMEYSKWRGWTNQSFQQLCYYCYHLHCQVHLHKLDLVWESNLINWLSGQTPTWRSWLNWSKMKLLKKNSIEYSCFLAVTHWNIIILIDWTYLNQFCGCFMFAKIFLNSHLI